MLSRLALGKPILTASLIRNAVEHVPRSQQTQIWRQFQRDARSGYTRSQLRTERLSLRERLMAPAGPNAFAMGKGVLAGGAAIGLGALCFYGIGLGRENNILNTSMAWPEYVRERIRTTYMYFGGSVLVSVASAMAVFRNEALLNMVARSGFMPVMVSLAAMIATGMFAQSLPYEKGFGIKQMAWMTHCAVMGAIVAPMCFAGGPILMRAAIYTAGVIGGLSTIAICAPNDKFLYIGGPLGTGLGLVFAASLASIFLPPTTAIGAGLYSISLYGGLLLFSGFLLHDTQRIVRTAEIVPQYPENAYDPVNTSISIYMDTLNIFVRIVAILAGGGGNRRK